MTAVVVGGFVISSREGASLYAAKPNRDPVLFDVDVTGDMLLLGTFNSDGSIDPGFAVGEVGKNNVVVNRPSPALRMDFLAALPCFETGDIFSFDGFGTLSVLKGKRRGGPSIRYFFRAPGLDGSLLDYRIDGDAVIVPDNPGSSFPTGDPDGYTVYVTNIRLTQESGNAQNGCEGSFPNAIVTIRLNRK